VPEGLAVPLLLPLGNGECVERERVPFLEIEDLHDAAAQGVARGMRIAALFGVKEQGDDVSLYVVLADDRAGALRVARSVVAGREFASLTPRCTQAHLFEREIAEQFGLVPLDHPWPGPLRFAGAAWPRDGQPPAAPPPLPGVADFYRVEGPEVHEVAVGPVHAGVIEPGHFRFQCHGEHVFHLEISLGYQHRGVERAMCAGPDARSIHYMETLAGDTTVGHATAYCRAVESLAACPAPPRAEALRGVALELERLANHVGDLGALANDVGFLPTASYCGRLRGDFLNMTGLLCGNRFGRGLLRPGGCGFDAEAALAGELLQRLDAAERDTRNAVNLLWDSPSVMARFEETGALSREAADRLGLVGPAARACGAERDVRRDHAWGVFRSSPIPVASAPSGDVYGRAWVRWLEIQHSIAFIREQLRGLPPGAVRARLQALGPDAIAVCLVEGWRGEICHVAITDSAGRFARYKAIDPSFHNWSALAMAMRDQQISDFPLCNKSFNLSYCGHDL
jgi:Ni,Fe-hydrogenase III large subunit